MKKNKVIIIKIKESEVKLMVRKYLTIKNWFFFPIVQSIGSFKGAPDIIACKNGQVLFIEVKTPRGRQSEHQKEFQKNIEAQKCKYLLVRDLDDLVIKGI